MYSNTSPSSGLRRWTEDQVRKCWSCDMFMGKIMELGLWTGRKKQTRDSACTEWAKITKKK